MLSRLGVDAHALEPGWREGLGEDGSVHALEDVELANEPVREGHAQRSVANDSHIGDVWGQADHLSGSIS